MKKLLLLVALIAIQFTNAQAPTAIWQKCYGGSNDDGLGGGSQTSDGGYIIASRTSSNDGIVIGNHGGTDVWIIKTNSVGTIQWQKCIGGTGEDELYSFIQTTDGGYIISGKTNSTDGDVAGNHGGYDAWMVKIDAQGTILWQKCFGGSDGDDAFYNIIQTSDGGFLATGRITITIDNNGATYTYSYSWLIKLTNICDVQWQQYYQYNSYYNLLQTSDGGYILSGGTSSSTFPGYHDGYDVLITKVNQGGNIQWQKCYGGSLNEDSSNIIATNDGGYLVSASSKSNDGDVYGNHGDWDVWVFKISNTGVILGQNCYGGSGDDGGGIQQTLDGGYLISGSSTSNDGNITGNHGGRDIFALKFSPSNAIQWQKCIGGSGDESGGFLQLADGTYLSGGSTYSNYGDTFGNLNNVHSDAFLIKLTAANLANENFASSTIKTYPNPMQDVLHVDLIKEFTGTIYDITGKSLLNVNAKDSDVSSLAAGIYILDIISEDKHYTQKIIKE
ncbi:T9SS type A sorting domain-containing protein [Flavobacterium sp. N1994]|uniref:T9SS type A sorting domain-containing protein n=1 Tax=Flavobacterium sp. N1994 TaxID=2986827 RepID=UPI0022234108|nr:T9SS type A sorting domain-containing protein [Flavobacterium sp. N1994]